MSIYINSEGLYVKYHINIEETPPRVIEKRLLLLRIVKISVEPYEFLTLHVLFYAERCFVRIP